MIENNELKAKLDEWTALYGNLPCRYLVDSNFVFFPDIFDMTILEASFEEYRTADTIAVKQQEIVAIQAEIDELGG